MSALLVFLLLSCLPYCRCSKIPGVDTVYIKAQAERLDDLPAIHKEDGVHYLKPGEEVFIRHDGRSQLDIFCYEGEPRSLATLLKTVELFLDIPSYNFRYYEGVNASSVRHQYRDSWFSFSPWQTKTFRLPIYNHSCIGIEAAESFKVSLKVRWFDLWRVIALGCGLTVFLMAPLLANNFMFHYATGVFVGITGSLLIVVYIFARMIPKRTGAMTVLVGGWGLVLYALQYIWQNSVTLLKQHQHVMIGYIVVAGLISFALVYRFGPIQDVRTVRLVQWTLQLLGVSLIFISSQYQEFTTAVIILLLCHYNIPDLWKAKIRTYWHRRFPPKVHLLTEEEYIEQTNKETKKALQELRQYCRSPDCNAWRTMSHLNSPLRFAEFVEGKSHITDEEILEYESTEYKRRGSDSDIMTDDDEEEEEG